MAGSLPDSNNVYSVISALPSLATAASILEQVFPDSKIRICASSYDGAQTLWLSSDEAEFDAYPESSGSASDYFLNGALAGDTAQIKARVRSIFEQFDLAGVAIAIEAYDPEGNTICQLPTPPTNT